MEAVLLLDTSTGTYGPLGEQRPQTGFSDHAPYFSLGDRELTNPPVCVLVFQASLTAPCAQQGSLEVGQMSASILVDSCFPPQGVNSSIVHTLLLNIFFFLIISLVSYEMYFYGQTLSSNMHNSVKKIFLRAASDL